MRDHYQMAQSRLLATPVVEIPAAFGSMERFRTKGKIRGLPEALLTLGDVREVVRYLCLRSRIVLVAPYEIEVRVPLCSVEEVQQELDSRRIFATVIRVGVLEPWDHLFLWRTVLSSRVKK